MILDAVALALLELLQLFGIVPRRTRDPLRRNRLIVFKYDRQRS